MRKLSSWADVSIADYQAIVPILISEKDELDKSVSLLSVLLKVPESEIEAMPVEEFKQACKDTAFLWTQECKTGLKHEFELDGQKYVGEFVTAKHSAGQYIDYMTVLADNDSNKNIHKIMAILYLPKGEKYDGTTMEARAELFRNKLSMEVVLPVYLFFYKVLMNLTPVIQRFSENNLREMEKLIKEVRLKVIGAGSLQSTGSQEVMQQSGM